MKNLARELTRERFTRHIRTENQEPAEDNDVSCKMRQKELLEAVGANQAEAAA